MFKKLIARLFLKALSGDEEETLMVALDTAKGVFADLDKEGGQPSWWTESIDELAALFGWILD